MTTAEQPKAPWRTITLAGAVVIIPILTIAGNKGLEWALQPNWDALPGKVRESINQSLTNDKDLKRLGLHVNGITMMHVTGSSYEAQAEAYSEKGTHKTGLVHVLYDGETMMWETDPGAFLFAMGDLT